MRSVSIWRQGIGTIAVICGVGMTGLLVPQAQADPISCGAVLGPGGSFKLDADVGPCDEQTAITVDSASLDLNGHVVFCEDTDADGVPDGIELWGKGARVKNGFVFGCHDGVHVVGQGKSTVENVGAYLNREDGFHVDSARNTLDSNVAFGNGEEGFILHSDNNRLNNNSAIGNAQDGFDIDEGLGKNKLVGNSAQSNGDEGFDIDTESNRLNKNSASHNGGNGVELAGNGNIVSKNVLDHNLAGIHVDTDNNQLIGNTVTNNEEGIELEPGASGNLVKSNQANNNTDDGIDVQSGATSNFIDHNTALGNSNNDLKDHNTNCDSNTWKSNTFSTANQGCIN
jgi:parallel beta-helix repeat protein